LQIGVQSYVAGVGPWAVAVGDFNGDGFPDLAVADVTELTSNASVSILINDGKWERPKKTSDQPTP
jgi:hypothetical protein